MHWQHAIRAISIVLLFLTSSHRVLAADIGRQSGSNFDLIGLQGEIQLDDVAMFQSAANASGKAIVILDSPGGNAWAGMEMGKVIHLKNFATFVPEDTLCASSCALMWLAGTQRLIAPGGVVGFHAVYIREEGRLLTSGSGNALVGAYLNQLGFSTNVIAYVTHAPPEKMGWLSERTAREIGLDVVWVGLSPASSTAPPPRTGASPKPHDPVAAVTRFYQALGEADGDTAAALVVPEKRGIGPFNEINMAKFFGDMREPLRLVSAPVLKGPDLVWAQYRWVANSGRVCNETAKVTTKYAFGRTFIQGIQAKC
jgi:hypothetical protein